MTATVTSPSVSAGAFHSLARLQQLTLEAVLSDDPKQLVFRILNRSVIYCRYDRAVLWDLASRHVRLLGVSGSTEVNHRSPLASEWRSLIGSIPEKNRPAMIEPDALDGQKEAWDALAKRTHGLSIVWLPIKIDDRIVAGLWLERWGGKQFTNEDLAQLEALALAYGVAWRSVVRRPSRLMSRFASRKRMAAIIGAGLLIAALCLVKVPLRIVTHCEVVPLDPLVVTAPLNGVIDEIPVLPGRSVECGELLAIYDKRVATEEMKVAQEQVQIVESDLQRSRVQAFDDPSARSAIALLENRLEQERIRLQIAQHRVNQLEVRAPVSGTLMFNDPHEWRGRPVQIGQRLMMIVDPAATKLRIWLPDTDNIDFDQDRPLAVILDSDPRSSRSARLRFLANHSQVGKDGVTYFRAEADWVNAGPNMKTGLQGTAILYGGKVPLGYWLLRRPFGAVRKYFGI